MPNADRRGRRHAEIEAAALYSAPDYVTARDSRAPAPYVSADIRTWTYENSKKTHLCDFFPKIRIFFNTHIYTTHYTRII